MQGNPDTRGRIVYAAMELFGEKGYGSTSVADILGRAGVNSGSLYHFFPGKQDVLIAVLDAYHEGIWAMLLEPVWQPLSDPIEKIFALLGCYRELLVQSECLYGCPIGSLALELHEPDPPVRERLAANFTAWTDAIDGCLAEVADRLPANLARRELAEFVLTTMEGAVMLTRTYRDIQYFDRSVAQLRAYVDQLLTDNSRS
ncbi:MAG TPA: TetR/AcrR family transcriptional regulator, partial [Steroidobacteraceae bacterium]|nr:TetR/AcrR family transcriptional regulator [Steroidobacteraceae bacterium]